MPILEASHISKAFPGVKALEDVSFSLEAGEVHALLGENGAGKSTLVKILSGIYKLDAGEILLDGKHIELHRPQEAFDLGISVIHQELIYFSKLNVVTNIFMGNLPRKGKHSIFVDWKAAQKQAEKYLKMIDLDISPDTMVEDLSISQLQMVEIAKALSRNTRIVIMDEPTSSLSPVEQERLYKVVDDMRARGIAIIYISHRLEEIKRLCDRVTVLRDGKHVKTMQVADSDIDELVRLMVGRDISNRYPKTHTVTGEKMLEVKGLNRKGVLRDISFCAKAGEILGISGFVGAGRTELARAIFGADKVDSGEILIRGEKVQIRNVQDAINHGIALLTENRKTQGILAGMTISDNMSISSLNCKRTKKEYLRGVFVNKSAIWRNSGEYVERLKIKTPSLSQLIKNLSGGNQQKVILGKWLSTKAKIVIFDEPTRGIDVGAKAEIYALMNQLASQGVSIIMISSELPEILGVSDRILVMRKGEIVADVKPSEASEELIVRYSTVEG